MTSQPIFGCKSLAAGLAFTLALPFASPPASAQTLPASIHIVDYRGEGAVGRVNQKSPQDPAIRVVDEKQNGVAGAAVVFTLPTEGATGVFSDGSKTLLVITDSHGVAVARGLRFNEVPGKVPVHINVSYKGLTARGSITEASEAPAGYKVRAERHGGSGKWIAILAAVAAAGAGGAVYATQRNGSSPSSSPAGPPAPPAIGITPGTGTLAPPR